MIVQECDGEWEISPPIGLPMANHVAHVLDAAGQPVPIGVPGELVIGGEGLARGYLNRPELTEEKFYPDPFGTAPGGRLYRTGDLVKRDRQGALTFLGRIDQQVKIRGLRIELGEIESVLSRLPEVAQVAVEPWQGQLVCYVAGRQGPPDQAVLREFLAGQLPAYMVPSLYVVLPALPLTPSGKVDRRRLPEPQAAQADSDGPIEYGDEVERALALEIVGPILGVERVAPERNFFEMGGHSLAAARVVSRIRSQFSVEIGLSDFFGAPTVRGLAALVSSRRSAAAGDDELLALLESMTDEEAAALISGEPGQ
jgi:acyl carrier protein